MTKKFLIAFSLTSVFNISCKKQYTCDCSATLVCTFTGQAPTTQIFDEHVTAKNKASKKNAQKECDKLNGYVYEEDYGIYYCATTYEQCKVIIND